MIAIITDFGIKDHYAGTLHGVVKKISPTSDIVDVTHHVEPFNIYEGLFRLLDCFEYFPENTVFLAIVDPGVGSSRDILLVRSHSRYFIAPDNGILTPFIRSSEFTVRLKKDTSFFDFTSSTFHGRDLFAPFAAYVDMGQYEKFVEEVAKKPKIIEFKAEISNDYIKGKVAYIDRFGNLVTNIRFDDIGFYPFSVKLKDKVIDVYYENYDQSAENELFFLKGSSSRLEISIKNGNASEKLTNMYENVIITKCDMI